MSASALAEPATRDRVLVIERTFQAPRELVWDAFTRPEHLRQWMGPRNHPAVQFDADARPGGAWRGCLRGLDDGGSLWYGGVFHEVERPERLAYTFQWDKRDETDETFETLVTVTFEAIDDDETLMTFEQATFNTTANRDGHNHGWSSSFDRLEELLASLRIGDES